MKKTIEVAVGVILNAERQILLAWRETTQHQGDCWEFPGGKLEPGESSYQALCRELHEEIAISVQQAQALACIEHEYEKHRVLLHPWLITQFSGTPRGAEGQIILWANLSQLQAMVLPPANYPLVKFLLLQEKQLVSYSR